MPVFLETRTIAGDGATVEAPARAGSVSIGLLNNLSDAGLVGGERQFIGLLEAASGELVVHLNLYALPQIARGGAMRERIGALYSDLPALLGSRLDGLIVTGCEPSVPRLADEPYWPGLTAVIDWAEHHTTSSLFSCLAAHAAVLHLDGIERMPIGAKRSGLYTFMPTGPHPLLAGLDPVSGTLVAHSRFNDLRESDLVLHGYDILTRSATAGVDTFAKQWRSLFVYWQGHPEYDPFALAREYRRDVLRYLTHDSDHYPAIPANYLLPALEELLRDFEVLARIERTPDIMASFPLERGFAAEAPEHRPSGGFHGLRSDASNQAATIVIRNWLLHLVARRP